MLKEIIKNSSGAPTGEYKNIAGGTLYADCPIGTILAYGSEVIPAGWMICDGESLLRSEYPDLFYIIGTNFGSADSTHFNLPDLREAVPKGAGLTSKSTAHVSTNGLTVGQFQDDRVQEHTHEIMKHNGASSVKRDYVVAETGANDPSAYVSNNLISTPKNARSGATTEVKAVGVDYIIKARHVPLPADLEAGVDQRMNVIGQQYTSAVVEVSNTSWASKDFTFTNVPAGKYIVGFQLEPGIGYTGIAVVSDQVQAQLTSGYGAVRIMGTRIITVNSYGPLTLSYSCAINNAGTAKFAMILTRIR